MTKNTSKTDAIATALVALRPFFAVTVNYISPKAPDNAYDCVVCSKTMTLHTQAALSYSKGLFGTWGHIACIEAHGTTPSTDKAVHKAARAAHKTMVTAYFAQKRQQQQTPTEAPKQQQQQQQQTATAPAPTVSEADLRAKIEAEYDDLLGQAIDKITSLNAEIAALKEALAAAALPPSGTPYGTGTVELPEAVQEEITETTTKKKASRLTEAQKAERRARLAKAG